MAITNQSKPSTSLANMTKVSFGETWATMTHSWASETRTWGAVISLFTDTGKPTTVITNVSKPA